MPVPVRARPGEAAALLFGGGVAGAEEAKRFDIDRAAEPGLEPAWAAGIVDARALLGRNRSDAAADRREAVLAPARQSLGALAAAGELAEDAIARRGLVKAAVEQGIGDAGLLLDALGELDIGAAGRAGIDDEIRLGLEHGFEIGAVAATGDAADLGPVADAGQQEFAFLRPIGARPADQEVGRERVDQDRRGRTGRKDALDLAGHRHFAAGAVADGGGTGEAWGGQRRAETGENGAAIRMRTPSPLWGRVGEGVTG